jgi:cytochrome P450
LTPVHAIDVSDPAAHADGSIYQHFRRLRTEEPVHCFKNERYGEFWSITKYRDIVGVELRHDIFSSAKGITIARRAIGIPTPGFIAMDVPRHSEQRKAVSPIFSPYHLSQLKNLIRQRAQAVLDGLPRNENFNWVERVSLELTTQMLATLFDFPFQDRHLLAYWSDVATAETTEGGLIKSNAARITELKKCFDYFSEIWKQRANNEPGNDLISMLSHNPGTRNMPPEEFIGNIILLIVGGNDTTRHSITGGIYFLHENPAEFNRLREDAGLIPGLVCEILRYQTPLSHMRRTTLADVEVGGKLIKKGSKVVLWYASGNRDEDIFADPDRFSIDRPRARQHLSFGSGIHRCVGSRLAEMQLQILWEEIIARNLQITVMDSPKRVFSNFVQGYTDLLVRIAA